MHKLKREAHVTSRLMDLFTDRALAIETGFSRPWWLEMMFKELVDNGVDAAEAAGVSPDIGITIDADSLKVTDNGGGMPIETIRSLTDFGVRVSTNAKYRSPTRGQQGQAVQTLFAVPYVVDGTEGRVEIETGGKLHNVTVKVDPIRQMPVATLNSTNGLIVKSGTSVRPFVTKLTPDESGGDFLQLATRYAFFNPHLTLELDAPDEPTVRFEATCPGWEKWHPTFPTSPQWYSASDLAALITACIAQDLQTGGDRTVREFVATFAGLSSSSKQKAVTDDARLTGAKLSVLVDDDVDHDTVERLLVAMWKHSREIKPRKLGIIGESHLRTRCCDLGGNAGTFQYRRKELVSAGVPYVIEAAFACLNDEDDDDEDNYRQIICGVNWSPAIHEIPFNQIGDYETLDGLLSERHCSDSEPVIFAMHLATPKVEWTDKGKSRMSIPAEVAEALRAAAEGVTKNWRNQRISEERDAKRRECREKQLTKQARKNRVTLKDAILMELDAAIAAVSGGGVYEFDGRTFFYDIRPRIQVHTEETLRQSYLDRVLKIYQKQHGVIDLMLRDPRGHLIEPHTDRTIPLGTKSVDAYDIPAWLFHTVLYVEKKGMASLMQKSGIAERYDIAIIAAEGYATDAAKLLMSKATDQKITLLCLHDADPYGKNIHRNLEEAGLRSKNITVIDIGLDLEDAINMGLDLEVFFRSRALPTKLELTDVEREHWEGEYVGLNNKGKRQYRCRRTELNSLAAVPQNLINYVQSKLELHGLAKKLVPPKRVVKTAARDAARNAARTRAGEVIEELLDLHSLLDSIESKVEKLVNYPAAQSQLEKWGTKPKEEFWRDAVNREMQKQVKQHDKQIRRMVRESLDRA